MYLVPSTAWIRKDQTLADLRSAMNLSSRHNLDQRAFDDDDSNTKADHVILGSGVWDDEEDSVEEKEPSLFDISRRRRRLQHVTGPQDCNDETNFYCWMSCLSIPEPEKATVNVQKGLSLYCVDPSQIAKHGLSGAQDWCKGPGEIVGSEMNPGCVGVWAKTDPNAVAQNISKLVKKPETTTTTETTNTSSASQINFSEDKFCWGGTSMYMNGFQWIGSTCAIYLFPGWTLNTEGKFIASVLGTIVFGVLLESVIRMRRDVIPALPTAGYQRLIASTVLYGVQMTLGYSLMLVVMIYSGPLFLAVVVGLMMGHILVNAKDSLVPADAFFQQRGDCCNLKEEQRPEQPSNNNGEGLTPCCQHDV